MRFHDREAAGTALAELLGDYAGRSDVVVLALPRGGVPVGRVVADRLGVPLDVLLVRKLGVPGHRELALGAVASGGVRVLNESVLAHARVSAETLAAITTAEEAELHRREQIYRGDRPPLVVRDRTAVVVDDGLATGASMRAALACLRARDPAALVVAVPAAPRGTAQALSAVADRVVVALSPEPFLAVSRAYERFEQVSDEEVRHLLAPGPRPGGG